MKKQCQRVMSAHVDAEMQRSPLRALGGEHVARKEHEADHLVASALRIDGRIREWRLCSGEQQLQQVTLVPRRKFVNRCAGCYRAARRLPALHTSCAGAPVKP